MDNTTHPVKWDTKDSNELESRRILQLCSILLEYPVFTESHDPTCDNYEDLSRFNLYSSFDSLARDIAELKNPHARQLLWHFWENLKNKDPLSRTEHYVATFDFNPATSLYLTTTLGNTDDIRRSNESAATNQGMALVYLKELYTSEGFLLESNQLPDYLPLFLEFLSVATLPTIHRALKITRPAIERLATELHKGKNPYGLILDVCLIEFSALLEKEESL